MAKRYRPGDIKWVAYPDGYARVEIVERGARGFVFRDGKKPDNPYVVVQDEEQFVLGEADLFDNPIEASVAVAKMRDELGLEEMEENEEEEEYLLENPDDEDDQDDEDFEDEEDED